MSDATPDPTWSRIEPHLDQALSLDPAQLEHWLAELERADPGIARAVRQLLHRREALNATGLLHTSPFAKAPDLLAHLRAVLAESAEGASQLGLSLPAFEPPSLIAGTQIGPYQLIREIGRGGMASVWLAERRDEHLQRQVALKLPFVGTAMHLGHFIRERDILATLTHPQIARLYDAGITERGQPYLAMEYVEGTELLRHCNERALTIRERLRVFLQVLDAVQFAHSALIIHRDLKPSNLQMTPQGRAVLLDFGIGKLVTADTAQATQLGRALTPDYASPEQIAGQPLGLLSDIYSLGVIFYELLTGVRPYLPARNSAAALEEAILRDELLPPSQRDISAEVAAARGSSARAIKRALTGDLDTIAWVALRRNPRQRYPSVTAFAQDIRNHLDNLPVSARPDSRWYRAGRFVLRHRIPVVAGSITVLALLVGSTLTLWQSRVATLERDRAVAYNTRNQAIAEFLRTFLREAAASNQPLTMGQILERSAQLVLRDKDDLPENRAAVLDVIAQEYFTSGDSQRAAQLEDRALALLTHSSDRALRSKLVCARAMAQSELGEYAAAVATITKEVRGLNDEPEAASTCLFDLSEITWSGGTSQDALRYAREALQRFRSGPHTALAPEAELLEAVGYALHLNARNGEAMQYFEQAMRIYRQLGLERRQRANILRGTWAIVIDNAGMPKRALELNDEQLRIDAEREPDRQPQSNVVANRARNLLVIGRYSQARAAYEAACQLATRQDDPVSRVQCTLGLAAVAVQTQAYDAVAGYLKRADELLDPGLSPSSPPIIFRTTLEARLALGTGHLEQARVLFDRALATQVVNPTTLTAKLGLAEIELATGNLQAAEQHARAALKDAQSMQAGLPYSNQTGLASLMLGRVLQQQSDRAAVRQALRDAVTQLTNTVDADHPELLRATQLLGRRSAVRANRRGSAVH